MDLVLNAALLALVTAPLVTFALWAGKGRQWAPALLFLALLGLDDILSTLPFVLDALDVVGGRWNWEGKALSLLGSAAVVTFGVVSLREAGVTVRQRPGSVGPAALATLAICGAGFAMGALYGGDTPGAETFAFQLTMPGLAEEFAYRGIFLALLHQAFASRPAPRETSPWPVASWWPVVVTAAAFGVWHALRVDGGQIRFDAWSLLYPSLAGLAYGWLRERTGSLVFPVIAHNGGNVLMLFGALLA